MGFQRAVVVGSGGIASYLWSPLGRLLSTLGPKNMILVDGDTFEKKNMERQDMRILKDAIPFSVSIMITLTIAYKGTILHDIRTLYIKIYTQLMKYPPRYTESQNLNTHLYLSIKTY